MKFTSCSIFKKFLNEFRKKGSISALKQCISQKALNTGAFGFRKICRAIVLSLSYSYKFV